MYQQIYSSYMLRTVLKVHCTQTSRVLEMKKVSRMYDSNYIVRVAAGKIEPPAVQALSDANWGC